MHWVNRISPALALSFAALHIGCSEQEQNKHHALAVCANMIELRVDNS